MTIYFEGKEVQKGTERYREAQRGTARYREVHRKAHRGTERYIEVEKGTERHREVHRGTERYRGTERCREVEKNHWMMTAFQLISHFNPDRGQRWCFDKHRFQTTAWFGYK